MKSKYETYNKDLEVLGKEVVLEILREDTVLTSQGSFKVNFYVNMILPWFAFFNRSKDLYELIK